MKILTTFCVWLAMGIADLVPGVSWGTIAFIAWVYERLLSSIHSINKIFFKYITQWLFIKAWNHIDWNFLITLLSWIVVSVFLWAVGLKSLLENYPWLVFSFFSWLIIASSLWFIKNHFTMKLWIRTLVWWALWRWITTATWVGLPSTFLGFFIAWALWSSAMILPWISWSYILLIVWMYEPVLWLIASVTSGDFSALPLLFTLFLWIGVWIIILWRILKKLYTKYTAQLILCMTGLMIWALPSIFPIQVLLWTQTFVMAWILLGLWAIVFYLLSLVSKKTVTTVTE